MNQVKPPIICITETNVNHDIQSSEVAIKGYTFLMRDRERSNSTKYGRLGIDVYLQSHIPYSCLNIPDSVGEEALWVKVTLPSKYALLVP